jgi:broad specificity phosphatase PhoE
MKTLLIRRPLIPFLLPLAVRSLSVPSVRRHSTPTSLTSNMTPTTFQVYPASHFPQLQETHKAKVKLMHIVRHAEGTHNVEADYANLRHLDARLTEKGMDQCHGLSQQLAISQNTILLPTSKITVVTSPLTRCVQTALHSFPQLVTTTKDAKQQHQQPHVDFLAHEGIRETVNFSCDRRRTIQEISSEFPRVNFSHCPHDADTIWDNYQDRLGQDWDKCRESAEQVVVVQRARKCFQWIMDDLEHTPQVVVCTHSAVLRCILNWGQSGGLPFMPPQILDDEFIDTSAQTKVFEFCGDDEFQEHMRSEFDNCELRSFCLVQSLS